MSFVSNAVSSLFGGGGGGGGGTQTVVQQQTLPAWYNEAVQKNLSLADQLANRPYQPYTGNQIAGFNQDQYNALQQVRNMQGYGMGDIGNALGTASRLQYYQAPQIYSPNINANLGFASSAGPAALAGVQGYGATNADAMGYGATDANAMGYNAMMGGAAQLNGNDISNYQNPYTQDVIDASLTDINRQRQMALTGNNAAATQARAFGGSRQAVTDALTNEAYDRNAAATVASLRNQGFNTALSAAQNDVANRQQMGLANLGFGNQAAQFGANALNTAALQNAAAQNQAGQFGASAYNTAALQNALAQNQASQFGAQAFNTAGLANQDAINAQNQYNAGLGQQMGLANMQYLNQAAQQNAANSLAAQQSNQTAAQQAALLQGNAATLAGSLANQGSSLGLGNAQALLNAGQLQQGMNQSQLDLAYQKFLEQRDYPYQQLALRQAALGSSPLTPTTSTSTPMYQNSGANILGGALGGAAIGNMIGGAGLFGLGGTATGAGIGGLLGLFSDENMKEDKAGLDAEKIADRVKDMPIDSWRYKSSLGFGTEKHIGPYAQDFAKNFGGDGKTINVIDAIGVNMAATKGLAKKVDKLAASVKKGK